MSADADEYYATEARRRRWIALSEDGPMFGLTGPEDLELTELRQEFGEFKTGEP